eukprot:712718-Ditylum_brightwellii.AAC.1
MATPRRICQIHSSNCRIASNKSSKGKSRHNVHSRCELDLHTDTTVAGANCCVLQYTGKECNVTPYREDYDAVTNVPIVHAATAWQSPET